MINVIINGSVEPDAFLNQARVAREVFSLYEIAKKIGVHELCVVVGKIEMSQVVHGSI